MNDFLFPNWVLFMVLTSRTSVKVLEGFSHDLDVARIYAMKRPSFRYILELYDESGKIITFEHL